ncbi:hypothetical protein LTR95_016903 [Oleoguttula sp. CCFEE 5521]
MTTLSRTASDVVLVDDICDSCRSLNVDLWISNEGIVLVNDLDDPQQLHTACLLCGWIHREFYALPHRSDPRWVHELLDRRQICFVPDPVTEGALTGCIVAISSSDLVGAASVDENEDEQLPIPAFARKAIFAVTNEGDPVLDFNKTILAVHPIGNETASHQTAGAARPTHLIDCFASYSPAVLDARSLGRPSNAVDESPKEGEESKRTCRLIDGRASPGPYAARSYRWGTNGLSSWITTEDNIANRKVRLSEAYLPKTIRDAVQITRSLHIRYLWIDAICIIQQSCDAWLAESAKMAAVFEQALVTICASSSSGSEQGIFNARSVNGIESAVLAGRDMITIQSILESGAPSTLHVELVSGFQLPFLESSLPPTVLERNTLKDRSWCCQETILSQRMLHFTDEQLCWECDHMKASEDTLWNGGTFWVWDLRTFEHDQPQEWKWYSSLLANNYSRRQCTVASDRLIAMSGLARKASAAFRCRYLAGLWADSLSGALTWRFLAGAYSEKTCTSAAPSWSWASQPRPVVFAHDWSPKVRPEYECRLLEADIRLAGIDEFGAIERGTLKLSSMIWDAHFVQLDDGVRHPDLLHPLLLGDMLCEAFFDNGLDSVQHSPLIAVSTYFARDNAPWRDTCDFLLVQIADQPARYRRVGTCSFPPDYRLAQPGLRRFLADNPAATRFGWMKAMFMDKAESEISLI